MLSIHTFSTASSLLTVLAASLVSPVMASHLASIYGTEQDKVNCSFYYKVSRRHATSPRCSAYGHTTDHLPLPPSHSRIQIGACRHGDRCSRKHTKPAFSQTIMVANVYANPRHADPDCKLSDDEIQDDFDDFYEDFFCQLAEYGQLVEMHVCDNIGDHLIGNVYARYEWEDEAQRAVDGLNDKWYNGRPLFAELSPVTDFREACCRQHETQECNRGGFCNFMHLRPASGSLVRQLHHELAVELRQKKEKAGGKRGWKEELAAEEGADGDDGPSWKKGKSSGNWRSGPRGEDVDEGDVAAVAAPRDEYAGGNKPTGQDGPDAGSAKEYAKEKREDEEGAGEGEEKMRAWQDDRARSRSPPSRA